MKDKEFEQLGLLVTVFRVVEERMGFLPTDYIMDIMVKWDGIKDILGDNGTGILVVDPKKENNQ